MFISFYYQVSFAEFIWNKLLTGQIWGDERPRTYKKRNLNIFSDISKTEELILGLRIQP